MDFTQGFNLGVQETQIIEDGDSLIFSANPEEIEEKAPEKEQKKDDFNLTEDYSSPLFGEEKEEVTAPKSEVAEIEEKQEENEDEDTDDSNPYTVFHETLLKQGIFSQEDEEEPITTPEGLLQRFDLESEKKANYKLTQFLSKFGEDKRAFFDAVFVNNVDPQDYFQLEKRIESVKSLNLENLEDQEFVISQYYKNLGKKPDWIKKQLKRLEDDGDTESEAQEAYNTILSNELAEQEALVLQNAQIQQAKIQEQQMYTNSIINVVSQKLKTKDFDGIPLTEKVANSTIDYLTTQKWQLPSGELLSDFDKWVMELKRPENYETRVKVALLAQNGFDFSKIKTKAISEKADELFQGLSHKQKTKERKQSTNQGFTF